MKLRTRITLLCSIVLIFTLLCADFVMLYFSWKSAYGEAEQNGFVEAYEIFSKLSEYRENDAESMKYYLKTNRDDYTVCFDSMKSELYNNTVFSYSQLAGGNYKALKGNVLVKRMSYHERRLLVFRTISGKHELFHITDLRPPMDKIQNLAVSTLSASAFIAAVSLFVIYLLVKRSLETMRELSESTKRIANGEYGERIKINRNDEIGMLGGDFNKMAQAIEEHTAQLEEEIRRKGLFMGNLTHELKTPLTAILGYAQTLARIKLSEEEQTEALDYINRECMRLSRLASKMMSLLELENGATPDIETVSVAEVFDNVRKACGENADKRNVKLCCEDTSLLINTDRDLLTELIINLTDNGIRASQATEKVMLYTDENAIVVEDFGCGIPDDEIGKITEPFYTVDRSRCRKNGGAGLGLSLCSLIADRLGMKMKIESTVGVGTKITIYISMMS